MPDFVTKKVAALAGKLDTGLTKQEKLEQLYALTAEQKVGEDLSAEEFNRQIKDANPGYTPPADQEARRNLMNDARKKVSEFYLDEATPPLSSEELNIKDARNWDALMNKDDTDEAIAENDEFIRKLNSGDPDQLHDVFTDIMEKCARVDVEKISNMTDQEIVESYQDISKQLVIGMERNSYLTDLKQLGCQITEKEEQLFKDITEPLMAMSSKVVSAMERITNPYYPEVDADQIPPDFSIDTENGYVQGYVKTATDDNTYKTFLDEGIERVMKESGKKKDDYYYFDKPDFSSGDPETFVTYRFDPPSKMDRDCKAGKPLYMISKADYEAGNRNNIEVMQDFHGKGIPTMLPKVEKKPNGFLRFLHNVSKFFGGKGVEACNRYDAYVAETERITAAAKNETPKQFPDRAEKVAAAKKLLYGDLSEQDLLNRDNAASRTRDLEKMNEELEPNEQQLNNARIDARNELMKMTRQPSINGEKAQKCMATIIAATTSLESGRDFDNLGVYAEEINDNDAFLEATSNVTKKDILAFLGGSKQAEIMDELGMGTDEKQVSEADLQDEPQRESAPENDEPAPEEEKKEVRQEQPKARQEQPEVREEQPEVDGTLTLDKVLENAANSDDPVNVRAANIVTRARKELTVMTESVHTSLSGREDGAGAMGKYFSVEPVQQVVAFYALTHSSQAKDDFRKYTEELPERFKEDAFRTWATRTVGESDILRRLPEGADEQAELLWTTAQTKGENLAKELADAGELRFNLSEDVVDFTKAPVQVENLKVSDIIKKTHEKDGELGKWQNWVLSDLLDQSNNLCVDTGNSADMALNCCKSDFISDLNDEDPEMQYVNEDREVSVLQQILAYRLIHTTPESKASFESFAAKDPENTGEALEGWSKNVIPADKIKAIIPQDREEHIKFLTQIHETGGLSLAMKVHSKEKENAPKVNTANKANTAEKEVQSKTEAAEASLNF